MIKLIATDMDGTLLNAAHEISQENVDAIKYAQSQGITVAIATGRAFYEANTPVAETDLSVPYICLNGAEVRDESFNIMNTSNLNHELVERIKSILDKMTYIIKFILIEDLYRRSNQRFRYLLRYC